MRKQDGVPKIPKLPYKWLNYAGRYNYSSHGLYKATFTSLGGTILYDISGFPSMGVGGLWTMENPKTILKSMADLRYLRVPP